MYVTHFLQGESALAKDSQQAIEELIVRVYEAVHEEIDLDECVVLVTVNSKRVSEGDVFLGLPYDRSTVYLFTDGTMVHRCVSGDFERFERSATEHLYRSLYATARAEHIGFDYDCGLLEEVITEGLSEIFVTEKMSAEPKGHYTQFSDEKIRMLWERMKSDFDVDHPDIEKWFRGNEGEEIPPFTACSIGFAVATAYLNAVKKRSVDALIVPAREVAVLQNHY